MSRAACSAVKTLDLALRTSIPFLGGTYKEFNGSSLARLQVARNPWHQMGVCLDIILFSEPWAADKSVDSDSEKKLGENLAGLLSISKMR